MTDPSTIKARKGQVTTVKTPCTPKNSLISMASMRCGHEMTAKAKNKKAPTQTLRTSKNLTVPGENRPMNFNKKSLWVMRPDAMAEASCKNTIDATDRAANSATPVMGVSKKFRPSTSATINNIMQKIQMVPTAANTWDTKSNRLTWFLTTGSMFKSEVCCTMGLCY